MTNKNNLTCRFCGWEIHQRKNGKYRDDEKRGKPLLCIQHPEFLDHDERESSGWIRVAGDDFGRWNYIKYPAYHEPEPLLALAMEVLGNEA